VEFKYGVASHTGLEVRASASSVLTSRYRSPRSPQPRGDGSGLLRCAVAGHEARHRHLPTTRLAGAALSPVLWMLFLDGSGRSRATAADTSTWTTASTSRTSGAVVQCSSSSGV
jgi:hypothetical protein